MIGFVSRVGAMNFYFMVRMAGLKGAVTLANYTCVDGYAPWPGDCIAHVMWSDGKTWQVRDLGDMPSGTSKTFHEDDLPVDCGFDATPFYFLYPKALPKSLAQPPLDYDMHSQPGWRGNIILRAGTASTSYVGEYPGDMVKIDRGSLLSFATFQQNNTDVGTQFVLPNMRLNPAQEEASIRFVSGKSRKLLKEIKCLRNRVSVVAVDDIVVDPTDMVVAVSGDITGVPLYLTHTKDFSQLSFEHTHPPVEYLVFGARWQFQRAMKDWWIKEAFA